MSTETCVAEKVMNRKTHKAYKAHECITKLQLINFNFLSGESRALISKKAIMCGVCKAKWREHFGIT